MPFSVNYSTKKNVKQTGSSHLQTSLTWEKQQLSMRVSVLASYGCATNVPRCWGEKKGRTYIISQNFCGSESQLGCVLWLYIMMSACGSHLKAYLTRFTSNMVHMIGKVRLAYGRRSFPQHSLGVLKSDSQFLPVGHPKRAERKPQCLLTWDLRLLSIDVFTMPIGCQLGPMYCGIALWAQFSSSDSDHSWKPGTEANRAPSWNWLPLLAKVEPK